MKWFDSTLKTILHVKVSFSCFDWGSMLLLHMAHSQNFLIHTDCRACYYIVCLFYGDRFYMITVHVSCTVKWNSRGRISSRATRVHLDSPGWSLRESLDSPPFSLCETFVNVQEYNPGFSQIWRESLQEWTLGLRPKF